MCCHQTCVPFPIRMPPLVPYTNNFLSVPVSLTSFTSAMLLKRTRLQTTGPTIGISEKLSVVEFCCSDSICELSLGYPLKIIVHRTEETPSRCGWRLLRGPARRCQCALEMSLLSTLSTSSKTKQARELKSVDDGYCDSSKLSLLCYSFLLCLSIPLPSSFYGFRNCLSPWIYWIFSLLTNLLHYSDSGSS